MRRAILLALSACLASCAHVDTGQADYRIAEEPGVLVDRKSGDLAGGKCPDGVAEPCDPMSPARIVRRYMPGPDSSWRPFRASEVFSVDIEQGMIGDRMLENRILGKEFGKTAEIAILANVFEFAGQDAEKASKRFLNPMEYERKADEQSDVELKLIYFSDDIKRGQPFSFSNIPLLARSRYSGGSIGIQIVVMEVDAQTGPVASLFGTLARFGQRVAPVPGEVKDILFDLGDSLLSGSQDDRLFEYRFVLSAAGDNPREMQATFAPGRYVLMRHQDRRTEIDWSSLRLDHNTARLFKYQKNNPLGLDYQELREHFYMVVNIRRYPMDTAPEFYAHNNWSEARAAIQQAADARAAPLNEVNRNLQALLGKERSASWRDDLVRQWAIAADRLDLYSARYLEPGKPSGLTGCAADDNELHRRRDAAERGAEDALRIFLTSYRQAAALTSTDAAGAVTNEFTAADREKLVSVVAAWFMPWDTGDDRDKFKDATAFEAAFIAADGLSGMAKAAAVKKSELLNFTCQRFLAR